MTLGTALQLLKTRLTFFSTHKNDWFYIFNCVLVHRFVQPQYGDHFDLKDQEYGLI